MKKIIFITTNVEFFEKILTYFKDKLIIVLADSTEKVISMLLGEEGKTFDWYVWDNETIPSSAKIFDILSSDDNEYDLILKGGFNFYSHPDQKDDTSYIYVVKYLLRRV